MRGLAKGKSVPMHLFSILFYPLCSVYADRIQTLSFGVVLDLPTYAV